MAKKKPEEKRYDWLTVKHPQTGEERELNGYGTEMCLKPVPCDPETGQQLVISSGPNKGKLKAYPEKQWRSQKIQIIWMWPGRRVSTLLKLLKEERLTGSARIAVRTLRQVVNKQSVSSTGVEWEGWARDLIKQEEEKFKNLQKRHKEEEKRKKELRKGSGKRKKSKGRPSRQRVSSGNKGGGKQVDRNGRKGRPRSGSRVRSNSRSG